jgi:hypothetical protein
MMACRPCKLLTRTDTKHVLSSCEAEAKCDAAGKSLRAEAASTALFCVTGLCL